MDLQRILKWIFILAGAIAGYYLFPLVWSAVNVTIPTGIAIVINIVLGAILFGLIFIVLARPLENLTRRIFDWIMSLTLADLFLGAIGVILGLLIAWLISLPITALNIPVISNVLPLAISITFGYVGYEVTRRNKGEILSTFNRQKELLNRISEKEQEEGEVLERREGDNFRRYKILDTSVIIDGRINDIIETGFLEGTIVVPNFVLKELQLIADSSDSLKRARGRRGLDILNTLQKNDKIPVESYEGDFDDVDEVDLKLLRLAKMIDGIVVTNDFNLNKVAEFQNVPVLNINALANSVKPVVIPGEEMRVTIVKSGTERQQGVGYLDDGTMIVVEGGKNHINENLDVVVTSALQTSAGRMIFADMKNAKNRLN